MESTHLNSIITQDIEDILLSSIEWESFKNKTILVTGANGFLASYLIKTFLCASLKHELNLKIYAVVRNLERADRLESVKENPELDFFEHDMSKTLPKDFPQSELIIHAASKASPKFYGTDPVGTLMPNSIGTLNLLEHAVDTKTSKFLFISSGEVYGRVNPHIIIDEDAYGKIDTMDIRSAYAESKRMGELLTNIWSNKNNFTGLVARPFHTYGPGLYLDDGRVFSDFVSNIVNRESIVLRSDGKAERPFCYVSDAIIGLLIIFNKGLSGNAYNIGNPDACISMLDLANLLSTLLPERQVGVVMREDSKGNYLKSPIMKQDISIDKIKEIGWMPRIGLEEGFKKMILSYL